MIIIFKVVLVCLAVLISEFLWRSLIIPFLRLGEAITGSGHFPLTADALKNVLTGHASKDVLLSIVHAVSEQLISHYFLVHSIGALALLFVCRGTDIGALPLLITDARMADCCTICTGHIVHGLAPMFQGPGG